MPNKSKQPPVTNGALKLKEARAYLGGLSKPTMYRLIKRGLLASPVRFRLSFVRLRGLSSFHIKWTRQPDFPVRESD